MQVKEIDILTLIPQRPPFIMVNHLVHFDEITTRSEFIVTGDNVFYCDGKLLPAGIIENIAQTCAARIGYINSCHHEEIKIGVIGSVQNLVIYSLPVAGDILETEIVVSNVIFSVTIVDAYIRCNGEVIAKCNMKIALI